MNGHFIVHPDSLGNQPYTTLLTKPKQYFSLPLWHRSQYWALRKVIDPDGRCFFGADETEPGDPTPGFVEKAKATGV